MPLTGFFLGALFASAIEAADHWIAFALLGFIGANMLKEAFEQDNAESCSDEVNGDLSARIMFVMAVATSIDAPGSGNFSGDGRRHPDTADGGGNRNHYIYFVCSRGESRKYLREQI